MVLKKISIINFRNFSQSTFYFNPFLTIIVGKNAVGKTNLLEAIYFSQKGRGFREEKEEELINQQKTKAEIEVELAGEEEKKQLRIIIERGEAVGRGVIKNYLVNKKIRKKSSQYLVEALPVVIFSPSFIEIIGGEPAKRRDYFDDIISCFDFEYKKRLLNYENGLRKRNKILEAANDSEKLKEELEFWDDYLIKQADYITKKRQELIDFFNNHQSLNNQVFLISYLKSELSHKSLEETFEKQLLLKKTLVGPQRDDFLINMKTSVGPKNIHKFGSRSEQRLAFFWLMLNEINLCLEKIKKRPLVLLDDIFSELDINNKGLVLNFIKKYQTIITTTQRDVLALVDTPHTIISLS